MPQRLSLAYHLAQLEFLLPERRKRSDSFIGRTVRNPLVPSTGSPKRDNRRWLGIWGGIAASKWGSTPGTKGGYIGEGFSASLGFSLGAASSLGEGCSKGEAFSLGSSSFAGGCSKGEGFSSACMGFWGFSLGAASSLGGRLFKRRRRRFRFFFGFFCMGLRLFFFGGECLLLDDGRRSSRFCGASGAVKDRFGQLRFPEALDRAVRTGHINAIIFCVGKHQLAGDRNRGQWGACLSLEHLKPADPVGGINALFAGGHKLDEVRDMPLWLAGQCIHTVHAGVQSGYQKLLVDQDGCGFDGPPGGESPEHLAAFFPQCPDISIMVGHEKGSTVGNLLGMRG